MLKPLILAAAAGSLVLAAPAFADGRYGHHRAHHHFQHPKHFKHHGHGHYRRPVVVMPPPRVYYAPPAPVYYAPPPVVYHPAPAYPASGVSIRLHFPL